MTNYHIKKKLRLKINREQLKLTIRACKDNLYAIPVMRNQTIT